jgi:phosphoribosylamine--glycine ligase / phosphoribosylformylglycinamidine cyclo-ligase
LVDGIKELYESGEKKFHILFCNKVNFVVRIPLFGPGKAAAQLEGSKIFSSEFMQRHGIPSPYSSTFHNYHDAKLYVEDADCAVVIKASGLTGSKGVVVILDKQDALINLQNFMIDKLYGDAGTSVVIEEALVGRELTVVSFRDCLSFKVLSSVRDYKTLYDGDTGVNTGGMGSYAPTDVSQDLINAIKRTIIGPTIQAMWKDGK